MCACMNVKCEASTEKSHDESLTLKWHPCLSRTICSVTHTHPYKRSTHAIWLTYTQVSSPPHTQAHSQRGQASRNPHALTLCVLLFLYLSHRSVCTVACSVPRVFAFCVSLMRSQITNNGTSFVYNEIFITFRISISNSYRFLFCLQILLIQHLFHFVIRSSIFSFLKLIAHWAKWFHIVHILDRFYERKWHET